MAQNQLRDFLRRSAAGVDRHVGHLSIERGPGGQHRGDLGERAGRGQRGPLRPGLHVGRSSLRASSPGSASSQTTNPCVAQELPIRRPEHGPAPGGQDRPGMAGDELADRAFLPVPEDRLSAARRRSTGSTAPRAPRFPDRHPGTAGPDDPPGSCRPSTCPCPGSRPGTRPATAITACRQRGRVVILPGWARACA